MSEENPSPVAHETSDKPAAEAAVKAKPAIEPVTARDWIFLAVISLGSAALDLGSKAWALGRLSRSVPNPPPLCTPPPGLQHYLPQRVANREIVLIKDYLDLQYAENCGGAWGLLHGASEALRRPFFLLVTFGAIAFIVHLYRTMEPGQRLMKWALPLVLGGAIGNLVDRVRLGYVVDFIHMHVKLRFHWPTYNVADIAISVGIGLMVLEYIIGPKKAPRAAAPTPVATTP